MIVFNGVPGKEIVGEDGEIIAIMPEDWVGTITDKITDDKDPVLLYALSAFGVKRDDVNLIYDEGVTRVYKK